MESILHFQSFPQQYSGRFLQEVNSRYFWGTEKFIWCFRSLLHCCCATICTALFDMYSQSILRLRSGPRLVYTRFHLSPPECTLKSALVSVLSLLSMPAYCFLLRSLLPTIVFDSIGQLARHASDQVFFLSVTPFEWNFRLPYQSWS